ncbi:hypothetical protein ACGC1H_001824 [Rhizoctonia solani]
MSMAAPPSRHRTTSSSVPHRQPSVSVRQAAPHPTGDPLHSTTTRTTSQRPSTADRPTRSNTTSERPTRSNTISSRSGGHSRSHSQSRSHSTSTRTSPAHPTTKTTHNTGLKHSPSVSHRSTAPHSSHRQPHKPRDTMENVVVKNGVPLDATRAKPTRSMTSGPAAHAPQAPSRSHSTDRLDRPGGDKARKTSPRPPAKKSTHVDVIDKLDYSGIGAATFHHDGPFDACAPSRNKNKTKAPMFAFDDVPLQQAEDVSNKTLSPRAQATIMAMRQSPGSSPYAIALNTEVANSYGQPPSPTYASKKKPAPKKSALAEAWGIAEPEPFEEFSAGRQSGYEGSPMNGSLSSINNAGTRTGMTTSAYPEYPDSRPMPTRRPSKPMPPPQPIQLYPEFPEGEDPVAMSTAPSAYGARPGAPKRSRSLMQRFRKMRDNPNAPPLEDEPPMPPANEIRLVNQQRAPPVPERAPADPYYASGTRDKSLPAPPPVANAEYFERPHVPVSPGGGVTRKGSLMRKMKGVMSR